MYWHIVNTPKLWDSHFSLPFCSETTMNVYLWLFEKYSPWHNWSPPNENVAQEFYIVMSHYSLMQIMHFASPMVTMGGVTWNNTCMPRNFEWGIQITFFLQLLRLPIKPLCLWKFCNTNYVLVTTYQKAVNNKRHRHQSRMTKKNDCFSKSRCADYTRMVTCGKLTFQTILEWLPVASWPSRLY